MVVRTKATGGNTHLKRAVEAPAPTGVCEHTAPRGRAMHFVRTAPHPVGEGAVVALAQLQLSPSKTKSNGSHRGDGRCASFVCHLRRTERDASLFAAPLLTRPFPTGFAHTAFQSRIDICICISICISISICSFRLLRFASFCFLHSIASVFLSISTIFSLFRYTHTPIQTACKIANLQICKYTSLQTFANICKYAKAIANRTGRPTDNGFSVRYLVTLMQSSVHSKLTRVSSPSRSIKRETVSPMRAFSMASTTTKVRVIS